jgi:GNAT superfamily N-acetyltransferase
MTNTTSHYLIRETRQEEAEELFDLVKKLAEYERLSSEVSASAELFRQHGFSEHPFFKSLLVENRQADEPRFLGFALYFFTFSTFLGKPTLYLEDLFVLPEYRDQGIGLALLKTLADIALQEDCGRMEWSVLNWNEDAIGFYRKIGAIPMDEWTIYRLNTEGLEDLLDKD